MDSSNARRDQRDAVEPDSSLGGESPQMRPHGDKRLPNAQARTAALQATLADLTARRADVLKELTAIPSVAAKLPSHAAATNPTAKSEADANAEKDAAVQAAKDIVQQHIRRLQNYNEMRDIGQGLMGIIAESRGVRIKEVQEEFDISAND
ncbi:putative dna repair protein swi5 protein [Lasiodiplodia theobromae]|uniref:DNA repair protein SWI5-like protein n=1 Tax=Lasiodiplodia theobromae TaxID=45133 RepID=A0A5N5DHQ0_9PEZI|nr:DNA repair protein [Lasiodiplodia theobromae]KAB2576542.1 DNA repair protein SWI5-like protein [Lasiodiplodia theobromae]KAF4546576.1 DNA repair protein [Lasiodiplodia theobromae]KAF9631987.1 putative dna repair protein swi5 protein [Lasiodiplodia theobromae]